MLTKIHALKGQWAKVYYVSISKHWQQPLELKWNSYILSRCSPCWALFCDRCHACKTAIFSLVVWGGGVGQSVKRPTPKPWAHCPIYTLPPAKLCVSLYVYIYIYSRSHSVYTLYYIYCSSVWGLDLFKGSVPKCFVAFPLTIAGCCNAPYESNSL